MRIGELAQKTGVSTKTIRYYEDVGVLPPPERARNGYRQYDDRAVERLVFVKDAQAAGLTLGEVGEILELRAQGEPTCHHVIGLLEDHLREINDRLASLRQAKRHLEALTDRARRLDPADCTDPDRCQTIARFGRRH